MKLYMVRHGQSETNLRNCYTGWSQAELTEKGRQDAEKAGQYLRGVPFDRVYASDLVRAVDTARIALPGCEPIQTPLLREIGLGRLEMQSVDACLSAYPQLEGHRRQYDFTFYGGENYQMMRQRVREFLTRMEGESGENIAAFCHAGTLLTALDVVMDMRLDRQHVRCPNCNIAVFHFEKGRWALGQWGAGL